MAKTCKKYISKINRGFISVLILLLNGGCSYTRNRIRDFSDAFTVSGESNMYGVSAQLMPFHAGVGRGKGEGVGFRSGTLGRYSYLDTHWAIVGHKMFTPEEQRGRKDYDIWYGAAISHARFTDDIPWQAMFQTEIAVGFWAGFRLGFNLAEFMEFFTGFTTLDFMHDDEN
jgi:hypothetical protein